MNKIKFSHDYIKLPLYWDGTQAILFGVQYIPDMDSFKKWLPQLIEIDTKFRGEPGKYEFNFKEGILLVLFHINSATFFTTIRRYTDAKYEYYKGEYQETFELIRTEEMK